VTLGLIDPQLLELRPEQVIADELAQILLLCRQHSIVVPSSLPYWNELWSTMGARLEQTLGRGGQAYRAVQELRKPGTPVTGIPPAPEQRVRVWGFAGPARGALFDGAWPNLLAEAAVRAALTRQRVVLLCRHVQGRNLDVHQHANITLDEIVRWSLYVQPPVVGPVTIDCCTRPRNLAVPWTIRMDWRLPDTGRYPYCPMQNWRRGATRVFKTARSRPAWLDVQGNEWARPNISAGSGYHWHVYVNTNHHSRLGLEQINVVAFGGAASEGVPGSIHHMDPAKKAHFTDRGWTCP